MLFNHVLCCFIATQAVAVARTLKCLLLDLSVLVLLPLVLAASVGSLRIALHWTRCGVDVVGIEISDVQFEAQPRIFPEVRLCWQKDQGGRECPIAYLLGRSFE